MQDYKPGDRVYRYVWTGGNHSEPQELTVVRQNRKTVTVRTNEGNQIRVSVADIVGYVDWQN